MKIVHKKTEDLNPYENNARQHSDEQVAQIAASIVEFGFNNPVLINANNRLIAGHGRLLAAMDLGLEEIPCIVLDGLSEAQERAYVIADNKLSQNSSWDEYMLKMELGQLEFLDFDIDLLGFDADELAEIMSFDAPDLDYSALSSADLSGQLDQMQRGVRKAIQIEFMPNDYEEAKNLSKTLRDKDCYLGGLFLDAMRKESK